MNYQPKKKRGFVVSYTKLQLVAEAVGLGLLVVMMVYTAWKYRSMPDTIPMHYNYQGEADRYGSRITVWTLPILGVLMSGFMTVMGFFPGLWSYPSKMKPEKQGLAEHYSRWLMIFVKIVMILMFLSIQYSVVNLLVHFPVWLTLLEMGLMFGGIAVYFVVFNKNCKM